MIADPTEKVFHALLVAALIASMTAVCAVAQEHPNLQRGMVANSMLGMGSGPDTVNVFNGNLSLTVPLGGRYPVSSGLSYGFTLRYNSNVWDYIERWEIGGDEDEVWIQAQPALLSNAGLGWMLSLGKLWQEPNRDGDLVYVSPDGARHRFYTTLHADDPSPGTPYPAWYTRDGSYLRLKKIEPDPVTGFNMNTVEFPNGTIHTFESPTQGIWRLKGIEDPFENYVEVSYNEWCRQDLGRCYEEWTITDSVSPNRVHRIRFVINSLTPFDTEERWRVVWANLAGPEGAQSCYRFTYKTWSIPRSCKDNDNDNSEEVLVRVLDKVIFPDGSANLCATATCADCSFAEFQYNVGEALAGFYCSEFSPIPGDGPGTLRHMRLPTGGEIAWTYGTYKYPTGNTWCGYNPYAPWLDRTVEESTGVIERELSGDFVGSGVWTYTPEVPYGSTDPEVTRTVVTPEGDSTVHYFNTIADRCNEPHFGWGPYYGWDYGLPYTPLVANGGLFLSEVQYEHGNPNPVRTRYMRYEHDVLSGSSPHYWYNTNRRNVESRTVYGDDGDRYAGVYYGSFDAYGNYRSSSTYGNFDSGNDRTEIIGFNPNPDGTMGYYLVDHDTNTNTQTGWIKWPVDDPWVLGTFVSKWVTESGGTHFTEFCFDPDTGFLDGVRHRRDPAGRRTHDIIVSFIESLAAPGNVGEQRYYGADTQWLPTSTASSACDPGTNSPSYSVFNEYEFGVLSRSFSLDDGVAPPVEVNNIDRDVDPNTGLTLTDRDISGYPTRYTYDKLGRVVEISPHDAARTKVTYTPALGGSSATIRTESFPRLLIAPPPLPVPLATESSSSLRAAEYTFDDFGRLAKESHRMPGDGVWNQRLRTYNGLGWLLSVSEWQAEGTAGQDLRATEYQDFDAFGRSQKILLPDGHQQLISYSGVREVERTFQVGTTITPSGSVTEEPSTTTTTFDRQGRLWRVVEPAGPGGANVTTAHLFYPDGQLKRATMWSGADQQVRTFWRDNLGFLRSEDIPEKDGLVQYQKYDALGRVGRTIDGDHDLSFVYDSLGRPLEVRETGSTGEALKRFFYYPDSSLPAVGTGWSFGKLGRSVRNSPYELGGTPYNFRFSETLTYGGIAGAVDTVENVGGIDGGYTYTFEHGYSWSALGQLAKINYPDLDWPITEPDRVVRYDYDDGWLTSVWRAIESKGIGYRYLDAVTYHPNGVRHRLVHGNGVVETQTLGADSMARPGSLDVNVSGSADDWASGIYSYDGSGNIIRIGDRSYAYDKVSRIKQFRDGTDPPYRLCLDATYEYDGFGNLLRVNHGDYVPAASNCTLRLSSYFLDADPATNRLLDHDYDPQGNLLELKPQPGFPDTLGLEYTVFNEHYRSETASGPRIAGFDITSERVAQFDPRDGASGETRYSIRDPNGRTLREYAVPAASSLPPEWRKDYIWAGSLLVATVDPDGVHHLHADHLGSPRLITDAQGSRIEYNEYKPFGQAITNPYDDQERFKFTGQERDNLGQFPETYTDLDYVHARFFSPYKRRWLSIDPAPADPARPQTWNRYTYVLNNPIRYVDPLGLEPKDQLTGGCRADSAGGDNLCGGPTPEQVFEHLENLRQSGAISAEEHFKMRWNAYAYEDLWNEAQFGEANKRLALIDSAAAKKVKRIRNPPHALDADAAYEGPTVDEVINWVYQYEAQNIPRTKWALEVLEYGGRWSIESTMSGDFIGSTLGAAQFQLGLISLCPAFISDIPGGTWSAMGAVIEADHRMKAKAYR